MKKTDEAKKVVTAEMCDVLVRPVITEKALQGSEGSGEYLRKTRSDDRKRRGAQVIL